MSTKKGTSTNKRQFFQDFSLSYVFEYSRYWELDVIDGIPTLFDPITGTGVMQFFYIPLLSENRERYNKMFSFLKEKTLQKKMQNFCENQKILFNLEKSVRFSSSEFVIIGYEYCIDKFFYFVSMLQKEDHFLLVLFNGEGVPVDSEVGEISQVTRSIRFLNHH